MRNLPRTTRSLRSLFLLGVLLLPLATHLRHDRKHCTHGASSIGPVTISGSTVTGSTTPHTEACLP